MSPATSRRPAIALTAGGALAGTVAGGPCGGGVDGGAAVEELPVLEELLAVVWLEPHPPRTVVPSATANRLRIRTA
jgi:hypothetical protein